MTIENKDHDDLNATSDSEIHEKKDFLLNQENFERLIKIQRDIEAETEMRPTFKKLINALMTDDALQIVKQQLIEQMS